MFQADKNSVIISIEKSIFTSPDNIDTLEVIVGDNVDCG